MSFKMQFPEMVSDLKPVSILLQDLNYNIVIEVIFAGTKFSTFS